MQLNNLHIGSTFLWPNIILYPVSVRQNFVVCLQEPLLKLGVPWEKICCVYYNKQEFPWKPGISLPAVYLIHLWFISCNHQ